jgi:ABC-type glycerol-3-phosphate transport system substrate-binding protein
MPSPSGETARPTAIGTPPGTSLPGDDAPSSAPTEDDTVTLVLWTNEDYAPTSETEGGTRLLEQMQAFQQDHGVRVEVILKKRSGAGGLLDFLTTASKAAPSVLPDIITLSDADLYRAAQAGLLQALDDLVSPELLDDQFDFANSLTQLDGATMGVLYQADLHHLVFDTTLVEEPPRSWRDVYSSTVPFVFSPAAPGDGVNNVILIQYLALGGALTDQAGQPSLDSERLAEALEFFSRAQQADVIPRSVLDLTDVTTAWATYRFGEAGMVQVPASVYLAERAGLSSAGFEPPPLRTPGVVTVGHGWALAIVTQDPERQRLAAALIEHLLAAENSGAWTQAAGRLPTRYAAFDAWDADDPYLPFIRNLLAQARPATNPDLAAVVGGPLAEALAEVLSGRATPAEAAEAATLAVRGER